ncbi:MAG TPA: DUF308 domain-containing protein [Mycobacterium sp.]|nr:DUF308 domain-containing protein [Mycobacterium sp.]
MLIIALVLAVIGLAALVFAIVTSNALVAWVCIGASVLGVLLLTVDALRNRRRRAISLAEAEQPDILGNDQDLDQDLVAEIFDAQYPEAEDASPVERADSGRDD